MAGSTGLEPATPGLTVPIVDCLHHPHSQRLAYAPARGRRRGRWRPVATRCAASMTVSVGFKTLTKQILRGSLLTVHLSMTGVEVASSAQTAVRLGEPEPLTFAVRVSPGCPRARSSAWRPSASSTSHSARSGSRSRSPNTLTPGTRGGMTSRPSAIASTSSGSGSSPTRRRTSPEVINRVQMMDVNRGVPACAHQECAPSPRWRRGS